MTKKNPIRNVIQKAKQWQYQCLRTRRMKRVDPTFTGFYSFDAFLRANRRGDRYTLLGRQFRKEDKWRKEHGGLPYTGSDIDRLMDAL